MMRQTLPLAVASLLVLAGCAEVSEPRDGPSTAPAASPPAGSVRPVGEPRVLATGLASPWSIVRLGDADSTLISERDSGTVVERLPSGRLRDVGVVQGVVHAGEGGLLGLAVPPASSGSARWLYAYLTTATDNRIVRMPLAGESGSYRLGDPTPILTGLAKAGNHDGGRIAFGPDGMLYATVGDAGQPSRAQDPASLNGKILRMTPTGGVPRDNPSSASLVYSLGHRNPQGIAWDADGQLWAAEFGQNTWDEFNRIEPGGNYGWPVVEGIGSKSGFIDPLYQWPTADASPSGLAFAGGTFFLAALRGERLWAINPGSTITAQPYFTGDLGRLRDAVAGPDGSLWVLTNNTDGRGTPGEGDDKLVEVRLDVSRAG
ncbi:PQQ-dependent sugar dehydrogenase [Frigoribacterium sp. UYMn621]|uniref:PQQ-dependent sugar dehydrogenase n=1 Tax=Frigoribacterium sp. UYMn621 TaxID=3156343 RepID=UPI00339B1AB8